MNRRGVNIERALFPEFRRAVADDFARNIVEVRFDHPDLIARGRGRALADKQPQDVGMRSKILVAGAVSDAFDAHRRKRAVSVDKRGQNCGAGRRREFRFHVRFRERHPLQEFSGRGGWNTATAVLDLNEPTPRRHGRAKDSIDAKQVPADCGAADIGNRIDRADFVEMNFADRRPVNLGLGFTEFREDALGQILLPRRQRRGVNHVRNVVQMSVGMFRLMLDRHLRSTEPLPFHFRLHQPAGGQLQRIDSRLNSAQFHAGIHQRAQRHITADTAQAI